MRLLLLLLCPFFTLQEQFISVDQGLVTDSIVAIDRMAYVACDIKVTLNGKFQPLLLDVNLSSNAQCVDQLAALQVNLRKVDSGPSNVRRIVAKDAEFCNNIRLVLVTVERHRLRWIFRCDFIRITAVTVHVKWPTHLFGLVLLTICAIFVGLNSLAVRRLHPLFGDARACFVAWKSLRSPQLQQPRPTLYRGPPMSVSEVLLRRVRPSPSFVSTVQLPVFPKTEADDSMSMHTAKGTSTTTEGNTEVEVETCPSSSLEQGGVTRPKAEDTELTDESAHFDFGNKTVTTSEHAPPKASVNRAKPGGRTPLAPAPPQRPLQPSDQRDKAADEQQQGSLEGVNVLKTSPMVPKTVATANSLGTVDKGYLKHT